MLPHSDGTLLGATSTSIFELDISTGIATNPRPTVFDATGGGSSLSLDVMALLSDGTVLGADGPNIFDLDVSTGIDQSPSYFLRRFRWWT
jgi:hypothetical protein